MLTAQHRKADKGGSQQVNKSREFQRLVESKTELKEEVKFGLACNR